MAGIRRVSDLGASAFGVQEHGYTSGQYYGPHYPGTSNLTVSNERAYFQPFYNDKNQTFDRIAIRSGTSFSGTAIVRLGIYNNDVNTFLPSTVNLDAGTVSVTVASTTYAITISHTLARGWYWLAFCQQGTAPTTGNYSSGTSSVASLQQLNDSSFNIQLGWSQAGVTGAFSSVGSLSINGQLPRVLLRTQ
jgi:hypothetical protein